MGRLFRRSRAISSRPTAAGGRRTARTVLIAMGAIFTLVGGVAVYFLFIRPVLLVQEARGWVATPCVIESSEVLTHRGDDSNTYSVHIVYRYTADGREHRADRYHFMGGSTSGRSGKQAVVNRYPPGAEATCYVDPSDPTQAVIERGFTADMLFGLIPLVFLLAGVVMLVSGLRMGRASAAGASSSVFRPAARRDGAGRAAVRAPASAPAALSPAVTAEPVTLRSDGARRNKLIAFSLIALFWNAFSWGFLVFLYRDGEWVGVAFLSLFAAIGLGLVGGVIYAALAMLNPVVALTLDRQAVRLGEPLTVEWELTGNTGRLDRFRITLEGHEEATYQRGTDTVTDRHPFRAIELVDVADRTALLTARGRGEITFPADTAPSWSATRNKIVWKLRAHGTIRRWPDVNDEFEFTVLPLAVSPQPHQPEPVR